MTPDPVVPPSSSADAPEQPIDSDRDQISQNIDAVLKFYTREEKKISHWQRILEHVSGFIGQPVFLGFIHAYPVGTG